LNAADRHEVVLPAGTTTVPIANIPNLIVAALDPPNPVMRMFAQRMVYAELDDARRMGKVALFDPATGGRKDTYSAMVPLLLSNDLVSIADLEAYVAPKGLTVRVEAAAKPNLTPVKKRYCWRRSPNTQASVTHFAPINQHSLRAASRSTPLLGERRLLLSRVRIPAKLNSKSDDVDRVLKRSAW
jgi:hypothetical protein